MVINRDFVFSYVMEKYGTSPDYPWESTPDAAVLRKSNKKWYGLVMQVKKSRVGLDGEGCIDILNVKCSSLVREILIGEGKAVPAYHMNKRLWISVILEKVSGQEVCGALDESYELVK